MRRVLAAVAVVVVALVAARAALPLAIVRYVNQQLDRTEGHRGSVEDVDLALLRGAYRIEDVVIEKVDGDVPVPLLRAPLIDLSVDWSALFHGELVGEVHFREPQLNLVAGPAPEDRQAGTEGHWSERVGALFPFRIDRLHVHGGEVRFRNFHSDPPVDLATRDLELTVRNLTNVRESSEERPATAAARGVAFDSGRFELDMDLDPFASAPDFRLRARAEEVELVHLNEFFAAYAGVDVESGVAQVLLEVDCDEGRYDGYVKPLVRDLDVLRIRREGEQGPLATLWEALFGGTAEALENQLEGQQAARVPISGTFADPRVGLVEAVETVFRNAFVDAIEPRFDGVGGA